MSRKREDTILGWAAEAASREFIKAAIEAGFDPDNEEEVPSKALVDWRAKIWDRHRGCLCSPAVKTKRHVAGLVEEFVRTDGLSKAEKVEEFIDRARHAPPPIAEFDPAEDYVAEYELQAEAHERLCCQGEVPVEIGPLTELEVVYYGESCCVHLAASAKHPHTPTTAIEDSWADEWGEDADELSAEETLHRYSLHTL